jgi:uncharacterized protein YndB with AHSA1/START domain
MTVPGVQRDDTTKRRWIELEVEVPGSPEEVWRAIATGPGISAWFTPTEVEERAGGAVTFHMGAESSIGVVTAWEPRARFAVEEPSWTPGAPPLVTELRIEARGGGTCLVRLASGLFAETDDWDDHLGSMETGWSGTLRVLRAYLARFRGESATMFHVPGGFAAEGRQERALSELTAALGIAGVAPGERFASSGGPLLSGTLEEAGARESVLVLDEPAPGLALIGAYDCGGVVMPFVTLYLYGERGRVAAKESEAAWRAWMGARFPMPKAQGSDAAPV